MFFYIVPLCEKFPKNVLFPHPMDACKLCKCEEDMTLQGFLEPKIICMPNPECSKYLIKQHLYIIPCA